MLCSCSLIDIIKLPFRKEKELFLSLKAILGFYPRHIEYYKQALMHRSAAKLGGGTRGKVSDNERLEFLGDAVLDAAVADIVFRHFPGKREGFLTNTRSKIVQRETLGKLAREMGIEQLVHSANGRGTAHNSYMGGNAFEAIVGAIYLDRGYEACIRFMERRVLEHLINIDKVAYKDVNFKSKLIEWCQKNRVSMDFQLLSQERDATSSSQVFRCRVVIEGVDCSEGSGYSKKESQQTASQLTLKRLRKEPQLIKAIFAAKSDRVKSAVPADGGVVSPSPQSAGGEPAETSDGLAETAQPTAVATAASRSSRSGEPSREDIIAAAEAAAFAEN